MSQSSHNAGEMNDRGVESRLSAAGTTDHCLRMLGLQRNPFSMAPDVANFYSPPRVGTIIVEILQLVETRMGFALLYGDVGLGKTTLCRRILVELDRRGIQTALVFNTSFQGAELLQEINRDFGVTVQDASLSGQMVALNAFLLEQRAVGRNCVIIIDDAQNLTVESLELVRQISNMETGIDKIVQIILIGQSELEEKLNRSSLRQLKSRIALKRAFRPYTRKETANYVRTKIARSVDRFLLEVTSAAIRRVHAASGGSPRRINVIMGRCLYAAVAKKSSRITRRIANTAIRDVDESIQTDARAGFGRRALTVAAVVLLIAGPLLAFNFTHDGILARNLWRQPPAWAISAKSTLGGWLRDAQAAVVDVTGRWVTPDQPSAPAIASENEGAATAPAGAAASPEQISDRRTVRLASAALATEGTDPAAVQPNAASPAAVSAVIQAISSNETPAAGIPTARADASVASTGAVAGESRAETAASPQVAAAVRAFLDAYDLGPFTERFQAALKDQQWVPIADEILNATGLRLVALPAAVTGVKARYATLQVPGDLGHAAQDLLFWRPQQWTPASFSLFFHARDIYRLQKTLRRFGIYHAAVDGVAGPFTTAALRAFQRGASLPVTGVPGVETLFMLEFLGSSEGRGLVKNESGRSAG